MKKKVITEACILAAWKRGEQEIILTPHTLVTPAARDAARAKNIRLVFEKDQSSPAPIPTSVTHSSLQPSQSIAIGSDHGGFALKNKIVNHLQARGYTVHDLGTHSPDPCDYPDFAHSVAQEVSRGTATFGIILDGAGIGSAMVANKLPGVRAACCNDLFTAANSREHNGANILTLGARVVGDALALKIVEVWLNTNFGGGRHQRRLEKVMQIDQQYRKNG